MGARLVVVHRFLIGHHKHAVHRFRYRHKHAVLKVGHVVG